MDNLRDAELRFKAAQERLASFVQEHMEFGAGGLEFLTENGRDKLSREYSELKKAHDTAGKLWAACLGEVKGAGAVTENIGFGQINNR